MANQLIYVGTYTAPEHPESIYVYEFDPSNGELRFRHAANDVSNPSFLAISSDHQFLYAVNEQGEFNGVPGGGVSSFRVDVETGRLTPVNAQPTHGEAPCYIMLDATERFLTVANYNGGITVLPVSVDARLGEASTVINHQGVGVKQPRQDKPHPHCTVFDPTYECLLVADLGLDPRPQHQEEVDGDSAVRQPVFVGRPLRQSVSRQLRQDQHPERTGAAARRG